MSYVDVLHPSDIEDPERFAEYVCQVLGTPFPTYKDMAVLRRKAKEFFTHNPDLDWHTPCRVVQWAKAKRKRPAHCWAVFGMVRFAFADGHLPELNPEVREDRQLEVEIQHALSVETDPTWRARLLASRGIPARREVVEAWRQRFVGAS